MTVFEDDLKIIFNNTCITKTYILGPTLHWVSTVISLFYINHFDRIIDMTMFEDDFRIIFNNITKTYIVGTTVNQLFFAAINS